MRNESGPRRPPAFLVAMTILAVGSLLLGVINQFGQQSIQTQRNDDRITGDLQACERGNVFRQQIIDIGDANERMITGILDLTFRTPQPSTPDRAAAIAEIRQRLDAPITEYRKTVDAIELVDCDNAVPGAKEPTS